LGALPSERAAALFPEGPVLFPERSVSILAVAPPSADGADLFAEGPVLFPERSASETAAGAGLPVRWPLAKGST